MNETDARGMEVEETGSTLEENALLKAREVAAAAGMPALADDTGLEVDALGGAPGVYSARYAGEQASYIDNCRKLVRELAHTENRVAVFRTVIALAFPSGEAETVEGCCPGRIGREMRGEKGFGYDPLFIPDGESRTFAELSLEEKNAISHRGRALLAARSLIGNRIM